jgi:DNA modification methylase
MVAKIDVNKVELVWPGKYNDDGSLKEVPRVHLPFQVIETINESRASREAAKKPETMSLFDVYEGKEGDTFEDGWKNKLIWGDNLLVMGSLLEKFAGKVDLIYIDPPFATGTDFSFSAAIGEEGQAEKQQTMIEEKAYRDTWGDGLHSYLEMVAAGLPAMRDLLKDNGTIYVHIDWTVGHYLKTVLDEIFGRAFFRNEIIWYYTNKLGTGGNTFDKHHDNLLVYVKSKTWTHNPLWRPVKLQKPQPVTKKIDGERVWVRDEDGNRVYEMGKAEVKVGDVWPIPYINPVANERLGFATQKPEALLQSVVEASSNEGDLVADFFCGSGTSCAVAERLNRRWIGCDLSRWAIHVTRKRLLGIEGCRPFEVLNLGKYERTYWAGMAFGGKKSDDQMTIYEYLAFILKLYGAQPLSGTQHLHGKKGKAMVHVGAVDAPVTIDEVNACIKECLAVKQDELHVLGWEWEMGMSPYIVQEAKHRGIKLLLLTIPREVMEQQAVDKGDIRFFELAHVEVDVQQVQERKIQIELTDFAFPYADLIPEDVREKITKWSDYVDYWAIDWDFQSDTFMQGWVAYRTRKDRALPLTSDSHTYEAHRTVIVMIKVVDIFGNDTSQVFPVEV